MSDETRTERAALQSRIRAECEANGIPLPPDGPLEAQLRHLMDGRDAEVVALLAERDRLARVLAVERGDESQAPEGWERYGDGWRRSAAAAVIQRFGGSSTPYRWERRGVRFDDPRHQEWPTALEAMEAIDAAHPG